PLRLDAASSPEALEPAPLRLGSERSAGAADSVAARSGSASASGPLASDPSLSELESTDTLGDSTVAVAAPRRTTRSRTSPRPHESDSRRFFATWSAAWLESQPMKRRPNSTAATPVVPDPQNGSSTRSPGCDEAATIRRNKLSFFCVAYPLFSVEKLLIWIESSESRPRSANSASLAFQTSSTGTPCPVGRAPSRRRYPAGYGV